MHDIQIWFLILSLFLPRLTLFLAWICGGMPAHVGVPFPVCVLGAIFLPRPLILVFIAMNFGVTSGWFLLHAFACAFVYFIYFVRQATK